MLIQGSNADYIVFTNNYVLNNNYVLKIFYDIKSLVFIRNTE